MPGKPERPDQHATLGIALRVLAVFTLSLMMATVKIGHEYGIDNMEMIFWRFAFALPVTAIWIGLGGGFARIRTRRPMAHVWRAAVGLSSMYFVYWSVSLLPLAEATTLGFAAPFFATSLSALFLAERVGIYRWSAIAVGFVGVLIVTQPFSGHLPLMGVAVGLAAALGVGCVSVTIRSISRTETSEAIVLWFAVIAIVPLGMMQPFVMQSHDSWGWILLLLVGLFGGLGQIFITASLRLAPISVVMPFDYSQLLWAVMLGWLIWGDIPPAATWIGAAIITATGIYTLYREQKRMRMESRAAAA
ncbi:DMT family transporter [Parasphingopyxis marina]|uniref:DMT family transporter n=1 Tax=Parasphingopyxis marina TaxID=2761622 RepID=A0A842HVA9_9SPHN|nr:DMT family transporter [Parasphingopyxis marina]MBC2777948.1 DMT family transporter [Parasphingopyxis marina]